MGGRRLDAANERSGRQLTQRPPAYPHAADRVTTRASGCQGVLAGGLFGSPRNLPTPAAQ
jgi:hypothetical protein